MTVEYLEKKIVAVKDTNVPRYGVTVFGYSVNSGAPTHKMIRLEGEKIWRRLMCWQFSNIGTCFVRINGQSFIVRDYDIPND